jgi:hypothetical protein
VQTTCRRDRRAHPTDQRRLVQTKINLIFHAVRGVDNLPGVHVDADFVADPKLPWDWVGLFRHGEIVCYFQPEAKDGLPAPTRI